MNHANLKVLADYSSLYSVILYFLVNKRIRLAPKR